MPAAGSGAGAASSAGFGTNFQAGFQGGGGEGLGGYAGRFSKQVVSDQQGGGGGMASPMGGADTGGDIGHIKSSLGMSAEGKRRAAFEAAGLGPYSSGLLTLFGVPWAG